MKNAPNNALALALVDAGINAAPIADDKSLVVIPAKARKARVTKPKAKPDTLAAVTLASFNAARSGKAGTLAILATGLTQETKEDSKETIAFRKGVQRAWYIGFMAAHLSTNDALTGDAMEHATVALDSKGCIAKRDTWSKMTKASKAKHHYDSKSGKRCRSVNESLAEEAARQSWSRILKQAGLKALSNQGGARTSTKETKTGSNEAETDATKTMMEKTASPGFKTRAEFEAHVMAMVQTLVQTCNKNQQRGKTGIVSLAVRTIIDDTMSNLRKATRPE